MFCMTTEQVDLIVKLYTQKDLKPDKRFRKIIRHFG